MISLASMSVKYLLTHCSILKPTSVNVSGHSVDDLDGFVEAKAIRAGQGGDQLAGQLHRQPLLPVRKRILEKTPIELQ